MLDALVRVKFWLFATAALLGVVAIVAPQNLGVVVYKAALVTFGVILSYHASRFLFVNLPIGINSETPDSRLGAALVLARAAVTVAVVIGFSSGL